MKKTYIAPSAQALALCAEQLLASSIKKYEEPEGTDTGASETLSGGRDAYSPIWGSEE